MPHYILLNETSFMISFLSILPTVSLKIHVGEGWRSATGSTLHSVKFGLGQVSSGCIKNLDWCTSYFVTSSILSNNQHDYFFIYILCMFKVENFFILKKSMLLFSLVGLYSKKANFGIAVEKIIQINFHY